MKGIILAGGFGTRLYPLTTIISKQLLPIYDKPTIYYPLSTLMLTGIKDILIISTPEDTPKIKKLLKNGKHLGLNLQYKIQKYPKGLADAFIIGEKFIGKDAVCMILGDNIFYGHGLPKILRKHINDINGGTLFGYYVNNPKRYGIAEFDKNLNILSLEEKPKYPKSNYAITGLYFYDNNVIEIAKNIKPSNRGEIEITDINIEYLKRKKLKLEILGRGFTWFDVGTHKSRMDATFFIKTLEDRQGQKISCIEEIAYRMGYINKNQLRKLANLYKKSSYGEYLDRVLNEDDYYIT